MTLTSKDFPRIVTKQSIVVMYDSKHNTIKSDHPNYQKLIEAFREERWDDVPNLVSPQQAVIDLSDGRLRVEDGVVYLTNDDGDEFTVSNSLNDNIMLHIEQNLDMTPLVNFAINLQKNPSHRSVTQLFNWIQNTNLTITDDGCFIAYKGVRSDFKDSHTGTMDNSPGTIVKMPRNRVDDDPTRTCSNGLHVATFDFASTWSQTTVSVKVNPADVVAVPIDYKKTKMRACQYEVLEEIERPITEPVYHSPSESYDDAYQYDDEEDEYDDDEYDEE